jgi:tetratricopeptide (TPR) repeat protein
MEMRTKLLGLCLGAGLSFTLAGCETQLVRGAVKVRGDDDVVETDTPRVTREKAYLNKLEKDPKDTPTWFELGEYYESGVQYREAVACYLKGNALLDQQQYTGGNYHLARAYAHLQEFERALAHLDAVARLEPKNPKSACLNADFRESHYLRGAIYFLHHQWKPAKHEFLRFVELGGDELRVEEWLDQIKDQGE